jgi:hypothetical protein
MHVNIVLFPRGRKQHSKRTILGGECERNELGQITNKEIEEMEENTFKHHHKCRFLSQL